MRGGDDDPATVEMAERAAAGLDEAVPVRVRQLLLILLARRAWPEAGADRQFERISAAAGGWPAGGADDVTAGGEMKRVALAEQDGVEPPPPFVFIRECVPYDASPCWKKGALTDGCKCHAKGGPRSLSKLVCDKAGRSHGCCSREALRVRSRLRLRVDPARVRRARDAARPAEAARALCDGEEGAACARRSTSRRARS